MKVRASIGVVVAACGLLAAGGVAFGQSVVMLPSPARGVSGISDDGTRIMGSASGSGHTFYFWSQQAGFTFFDGPAIGATGLPRLSGDGHSLTCISGDQATRTHAFIATDTGGYTVLPFTNAAASQAFPFGVSYDGSVVAGYDDFLSGGSTGWRWTAAGGLQTLPMSVVNGMSGDGNTVFGHDGASQAMVWHNGATSRLLPAPGSQNLITGGIASNFSGRIIGGNSGLVPAIWTDGQGVLLPILPGSTSGTVREISNDGNTALGTFGGGLSLVNFIWTAGGGTQEASAYFSSIGLDLSSYLINQIHLSQNGQAYAVTLESRSDHSFHPALITIPAPGVAGVLLVAARRPRRGGLAGEGDSGVVKRRRERA